MSFKKMHEVVKSAVDRLGFEDTTPFQKAVLPKIKSGADLFCIGEKGAGKSTAIVMSVLHKLKGAALNDAPRAIIFVKDKTAALALEEQFKPFIKGTDLRMFSIFDEQKIYNQKDELFFGMDIVITTVKRLSNIYFENGIIVSELQLLIIEDAEFLTGASFHTDIDRLCESLSKCQYLIFGMTYTKRMDSLLDLFMEKAQVVKL